MNNTIRIHNPNEIDFNSIETDLKKEKHVIVQFSNNQYTDDMLSQLNEFSSKHDENFGIRFYMNRFDCATLSKIPNVKCLYVDCTMKADNIEQIRELQYLKKLSLGVYELEDTEILNSENMYRLKSLSLSETKTKSLNLEYLRYFEKLQNLFIGGHSKNIDTIGELSNLECLRFHGLNKKVQVSFVNKLKKLKSLEFSLGGRENINEIEENEIEELEITWVRGFNDLGNISNFKKLRKLCVDRNIQLKKIHFDQQFPLLEDLRIINCKTFNSLKGLENLPTLKKLMICGTELDFDEVINQKLSDYLEIFNFTSTKKSINDIIKNKLKEKGYRTK